jgi:hypothetical protein
LRCAGAVPATLSGMAEYAKKYYNTEKGKARVEDYEEAYQKYK